MNTTFELRRIRNIDYLCVRDVYSDSIHSQGRALYSNDQLQAWSSLASLPAIFDRALEEGKGWLIVQKNVVEAFAIRFPSDRLALLYCRGRSTRQGFGTILLQKIELDALEDKVETLFTEASLFSYPLLLRCGWITQSLEKIKIAGIMFDRYRMYKKL